MVTAAAVRPICLPQLPQSIAPPTIHPRAAPAPPLPLLQPACLPACLPAAAEDAERAREVYRACLKLLPHRAFTFGKVWIMAAQFEVRALRLDAARKILGMALGMCPKVSRPLLVGWMGRGAGREGGEGSSQ